MIIYHTKYKDIEAISCESETMTAVFLPYYGAKMASLKSKKNGHELLEQSKGEKYLKPLYGGIYTEAECSAFDDMFPTIDPFICNEHPWKGMECPDHGEVYALKWEYEILGECLHMWVYSVRFGYRLDKWITEENGKILIAYRAENLTEFEFNYIYAAHCMLAAQEGTVIELPYKGQEKVTTTFSKSGSLGRYGTQVTWPIYKNINLSKVASKSLKDNYKFYFDEPIPEGRCICNYPNGSRLIFGFDSTEIPYLAVWVNTGGFQDKYNVAFEPCTGVFDRPDIARLHEKYSVLKGKETKEWYISFEYQNAKET